MDALIRHEFPVHSGRIHLNHAAVAPWPRRTVEAVRRFALENLPDRPYCYADWLKREQQLREQCRRLLNASGTDEIALLKNTSEALSVVALGMGFRSGENVVSSDQEFPSNRLIWQRLEGVEFREVSLGSATTPEEALENACDRHTRLLTISAVQYATGLRMDLERLGRFCSRQGILFCVDAIQQLGALPLDVSATQADFVMADGHKWLLGPEGLAIFYCARERIDRLRVLEYGWRSVEKPDDFERRGQGPAAGARRFECGSPNMLGIHALSASLSLFEELGLEQISARVLENTGHLLALLDECPGIEVPGPRTPERLSGIVSPRIPGRYAQTLQARLYEAGILCAARGGRLRFSPHFYTPQRQLDQTAACLTELLRAGSLDLPSSTAP